MTPRDEAIEPSNYEQAGWSDVTYAYVQHLRAALDAAEAARVKEWNMRRDADASRDVARAACDAMRIERDAAEARLRDAVPHLREPDGHWGDFVWSALNEADKAMRKFPQPNYVISKVAEEAGEVVKAAIHCAEGRETIENVRGEMRQLVAMLYRLWVEGDQVHGLPPVSAAIRAGKGVE